MNLATMTNHVLMSTSGSKWDIIGFLTNFVKWFQVLISLVVLILGLYLLLRGIIDIVTGLTSKGKQTNWAMAFISLFVGGLLCFGGFNKVKEITKGSTSTVENMGSGQTTPTNTLDDVKTIVIPDLGIVELNK